MAFRRWVLDFLYSGDMPDIFLWGVVYPPPPGSSGIITLASFCLQNIDAKAVIAII